MFEVAFDFIGPSLRPEKWSRGSHEADCYMRVLVLSSCYCMSLIIWMNFQLVFELEAT